MTQQSSEKKTDQTRLKYFVESVIRGGMLAIPIVGAAIEKVAFGTKDAVSHDELRAVVDKISKEMATSKELATLSSERIREENIHRIAKNVISDSFIAQIGDAIETATIQQSLILNKVLLQTYKLLDKPHLDKDTLMDAIKKSEQTKKEILNEVRNAAAANENLINGVILEIRQANLQAHKKPKELMRTLSSSRIKELLEHISDLYSAINWNIFDPSLIIAVDTSEIMGYAKGPLAYERRMQNFYLQDVVLFKFGPLPLYLLPGTIYEMHIVLSAMERDLLRYSGRLLSSDNVEYLRHPEFLALSRIKELAASFMPWPSMPENLDQRLSFAKMKNEFRARLEETYRKHHPWTQLDVDAENLAHIVLFNSESFEEDSRSAVIVSRDERMRLVDKEYWRPSKNAPYVITPTVSLYSIFLAKRESCSFSETELIPTPGTVSEALQRIIQRLNEPEPSELLTIKSDMDFLTASLEVYGRYFRKFGNWVDADVISMISDDEKASIDWSKDLVEIQEEAIAALEELDISVQRLRDSFEVFKI